MGRAAYKLGMSPQDDSLWAAASQGEAVRRAVCAPCHALCQLWVSVCSAVSSDAVRLGRKLTWLKAPPFKADSWKWGKKQQAAGRLTLAKMIEMSHIFSSLNLDMARDSVKAAHSRLCCSNLFFVAAEWFSWANWSVEGRSDHEMVICGEQINVQMEFKPLEGHWILLRAGICRG